MLGGLKDKIRGASRHTDAILAIGVVGLVLLLIIPLPPLLLDALLSFSIVLAVMTLLLTIYLENALEFSAFPSLLLFLTLFRLGLNIASTRMILTRGEGGDIIRTFGNFVTEGNTLVGLILFILLTVINFIVVTKGAGRIAEVAARFTLEALPGKQAAIDGELSTGLITQEEAKRAREKISGEAEFYGAMDGASKFVRGDAIAGIVITCVNIIGGLAVGFIVKGLSWQECLSLFTCLTVGDGLVSQIPALLISVGAGIIVTRASTGSVGRILPGQVFNNPKVLSIAALVLAAISFVPGMPMLVMLPMSATLFLYAYVLFREKGKAAAHETPFQKSEESLETALIVHPLEVQLGFKLLSLAQPLLKRVPEIRRGVASKLGIVVPSIHISDNGHISPRTYHIKLKGVTIAEGEEHEIESLAAHLTTVVETNAHELLNRQDVARMVEKAKAVDSAVVDELIPHKLSLGQILKVLQNLLKEGISIRDFVSILEALADHIPPEGKPDPNLLTEHVRQGLARSISHQLFGQERRVHAITLEPKVEQMLNAALQKSPYGARIVLRPATADKIRKTVAAFIALAHESGKTPVLLTTVTTRPHLRTLIEKQMPTLSVLSYDELAADLDVQTVGTLTDEVLI